MITKAPPRPKAPPPAPKPAASARRRPLPSAAKGLLAVMVAAVALVFGIKGAYGGFGHYYTVSLDLPRAGQQLETGSDVGLSESRPSGVDPRQRRVSSEPRPDRTA